MIRPIVFVALTVAALVRVAAAQDAPQTPAQLGLCSACHGRDGIAVVPRTPNLAGQREDYLVDALKQYRDGRRKVPQMRAVAGALSDAQIEQLARWYAAQSPSVPHDR